MTPAERAELEARLGHRFQQPGLLERAVTHASLTNERGSGAHGNERLEFLGDAVLDLVISELLMQRHRDRAEGWLSRARAAAVNTHSLARHARELELEAWMRLGRSERRSGGRAKPSILANMFEAVLGALYLDGGLDPVRALVEREFARELDSPEGVLSDPKTRLQEWLQARGQPVPLYATTTESGPPHAREFEVEVRVGGECLGGGRGRSKRAAERAAALEAVTRLVREEA